MSKTALYNELCKVPDVLSGRVFGTIEEIPIPETETDAIIAMGVLSANINNQILMPLSGLDLVELLLRVGQRNSTSIAALLAGLESLGAAMSENSFLIQSPANNSTFTPGEDILIKVTGDNIEKVEIGVTYPDDVSGTFTASKIDNAYELTISSEMPGVHTISLVINYMYGDPDFASLDFTIGGA